MTGSEPPLHPVIRKMEDKGGLDLSGIPVRYGTAEIAKRWGVQVATIRNYFHACIRHGDWRYLPEPDSWFVRDDNVVLPEWDSETIDSFKRAWDTVGPGWHARGAERHGYNKGASTKMYRLYLGVENAELIRKRYREGSATIEELATEWEMKPKEVQRIIDGLRWMPGTGKVRGRMDSPNMVTLGYEKAEEIRDRADAGEASIDELAEQFGLRSDEVEDIIDLSRWGREFPVSSLMLPKPPQEPRVLMSPAYKTLGVKRAEEIRRRHANDEGSIEGLAKKFEITPSEVQSVLDGERWLPKPRKTRDANLQKVGA